MRNMRKNGIDFVMSSLKNKLNILKRPANNSQVNYKKIFKIKNGMANKPFENTNGYKNWIF